MNDELQMTGNLADQTSPGIDDPDEATETQGDENQESKLQQLLDSQNIAEKLDKEKLDAIGDTCKQEFEIDLQSREHWERDLEEWLRLAMQVREAKSFPWPKASNVKYPLLSTAAMQFAARAYPSLVPSDGKVVKVEVIGQDPDGEKEAKAHRVATYMSYQVMKDITDWEEDMDKLLMMLPIAGVVFKKTYFSKAKNKICSYLVSPKNLVVHYWAKSLETAERTSEIIEMSKRVLTERVRQGIFLDVDLEKPTLDPTLTKVENGNIAANDDSIPYIIIEQHRFLDLDDDGYEEPYIVTFERKTGKVLRITARWEIDDAIKTDEKGKITSIEPTCFYTKFSFIPNPDGSFYDLGFGLLLGPLNESVNSAINQLIDSGTINNLQSGFIGKGLRLKMGNTPLSPGEWRPVNATADDLRKQIVPLPSKEPSHVLFQLMGSLITSGKELASVAEIFTGKMPGQNTPATTTMATVEQGMKVFTAVYKRIFRSLTKEFKRIYKLNETYIDPNTYSAVIGGTIGPDDFDYETHEICPGADPSAASTQEKLMKAQALLELLPIGVLDPIEVVTRVLQAQEQPNVTKLFNQQVQQTGQMPPPPPDPKMLELQMKGQMETNKLNLQSQVTQQKMELESRDKQQQMAMQAQAHALEMQNKQAQAQAAVSATYHQTQARMAQAQAQTNQSMHHAEQAHQQKLQHAKEQAKSSQSKTSSTGKVHQSQKPSSKK